MHLRIDGMCVPLQPLERRVGGNDLATRQSIGHGRHSKHFMRAGPQYHVVRRDPFALGNKLFQYPIVGIGVQVGFPKGSRHRVLCRLGRAIGVLVAV